MKRVDLFTYRVYPYPSLRVSRLSDLWPVVKQHRRPYIPIDVVGPSGAEVLGILALADSGSPYTLISAEFSKQLGLPRYFDGDRVVVNGLGFVGLVGYINEVRIRFPPSRPRDEEDPGGVKVKAVFVRDLPEATILGYAGLFEKHRVVLCPFTETVVLLRKVH